MTAQVKPARFIHFRAMTRAQQWEHLERVHGSSPEDMAFYREFARTNPTMAEPHDNAHNYLHEYRADEVLVEHNHDKGAVSLAKALSQRDALDRVITDYMLGRVDGAEVGRVQHSVR